MGGSSLRGGGIGGGIGGGMGGSGGGGGCGMLHRIPARPLLDRLGGGGGGGGRGRGGGGVPFGCGGGGGGGGSVSFGLRGASPWRGERGEGLHLRVATAQVDVYTGLRQARSAR